MEVAVPDILNSYEETQKIVKELWKEANEFIKEECDKIADVGNPEDLVHKPYERWTNQDMQNLQGIYVYDKKPLEEFIAKKEIDNLFKSMKKTDSMGV